MGANDIERKATDNSDKTRRTVLVASSGYLMHCSF